MFQTNNTMIIAEIGVNHNGDVNIALESVDAAKKAGADIVKFQTFKSELNLRTSAPKAEYQEITTGNEENQFEMVKKLELTYQDFVQIADYCRKKDIEFMSTAFDVPSLDMILALGVKRLKIPSGDIDNIPLLQEIRSTNLPILLSTGMSSLNDIDFALSILDPKGVKDLAILQCTTEYPCPPEHINLATLRTLENKFKRPVGLSDHSNKVEISALAVAAGASVIEKHFTLNNSWPGPDHQASLNPLDFNRMCREIRFVEKVMGSPIKELKSVEKRNVLVARKSIVAKIDIKKGNKFTEENLTMKRPADGLHGQDWFNVMGQTAKQNLSEDDTIVV